MIYFYDIQTFSDFLTERFDLEFAFEIMFDIWGLIKNGFTAILFTEQSIEIIF